MSKYQELRQNPPKLSVKKECREVIFTVVSCMCDNVYYLTFKKNQDGDFKMSGPGYSLTPFQMKHPIHDIEWEADEGEWGGVVCMINSGTVQVLSVKSR